ncbi:hypothetical protein B5M09_012004 [Aphanomyces astaci]|uniref:ENTH domain-containing protein n=1 Tax=Aphanomyces astaci TaxID=112090 RepID=A0A3R8D2E2_APHAT|nr:hypothetical protein B5M09_012004 [Aphanomyces astaci]
MSRELLSEATSIHEGPVPGYLLDQISRQLGANDGTPADKIADFLLNRMGKSNMNVKLKAMQVINVRRHFQGTADPAYGDEKNRRVRMAALEMLNYLGVPASFNKDGGPGTFMPQPFTTSPPANTNSEYERSLIDDLCPPGGLARAPPAENLARFLELAKSLDMTILGDLLLDKLEDDSWQVRLKGLCVWEALLEAPGCAHYADWLHENVDLLQHAAVATKAKRVLQLVGAEMSTPPVQKNQTQVDLLAMHDLNLQSPPFQPQNQNQTHAPPPENLLDLTFSPVQSVTATTDVPLLLLSPTAPLPPDASRHLGEFGKDLFTLANSPRNSPQPPAPQPEKSAFSFM